jgi:hypothetical protein
MTLLRTLYALAIALLVVAFVGFGISAFYPAPQAPQPPPGVVVVDDIKTGSPSTEEEKEQVAEYQEERKAFQEQFSDYNRVVSSIAIGAAVLLLVSSILWISRLAVIGDGVTFGAVFTLFYGLIRAFMTDDEIFRFIAVSVGLVLVVALVYWKFIRPSSQQGESDTAASPESDRPE